VQVARREKASGTHPASALGQSPARIAQGKAHRPRIDHAAPIRAAHSARGSPAKLARFPSRGRAAHRRRFFAVRSLRSPLRRCAPFVALGFPPRTPAPCGAGHRAQSKPRPRRSSPNDHKPQRQKQPQQTARSARPRIGGERSIAGLRVRFIVSHGGKGRSALAPRGFATPLPTPATKNRRRGPRIRFALDAPRRSASMNAQTKKSFTSCCWCGQPVGHLHMLVNGPHVVFGRPHRWVFCGLLCLVGWAQCERSTAIPSPP
jgi:hypothetical protein